MMHNAMEWQHRGMKPNPQRMPGVRPPVSVVLNGCSPLLADVANLCGPCCDARLARMHPHFASEQSSVLMLPGRTSCRMRLSPR
jgi:hypothetical protein